MIVSRCDVAVARLLRIRARDPAVNENMCVSMDVCKCGYVRTQTDTQAGRLRNTHMVFGFRQDFRAPRLRISFSS